LDPLSEQNEACDWMAFDNADALEVLKHCTMDATHWLALLALNMDPGLGGGWF
jgi:hypothetical protein